jgi:DNA (cytosine-5)-methyltransferase 1
MDKESNSKYQFRLPSELSNEFKLACEKLSVKPSEKLRDLITDFLASSNNNVLNSKPYIFPKKSQKNQYSIGEMYSGPGGIGIAAKKSKLSYKGKNYSFKHVWATDNHHDTCMTYQQNIPNKKDNDFKVICEDIHKLDIESLPYVDGFLYGFPCNDFSNVGETRGLQGKFGPLYSYGVKYINHHNPKFIFAENVSGLSNANSGFAFKKILSELSKAGKHGYDLNVNLYKFEKYGIPQARHRYIIVGFRKDLKKSFKVPLPNFINNYNNCRDAISIPKISKDATNNELTNQSNTVIERLKHIKPGENAWTADIPENLRLNVKGAKLSMIYKRLDPKKPAYTITGSGGGGTHVYHWKENRALTNRERARLQTFPDDFEFFGSKESVRRQIGMAVPAQGVQIILESILMVLAGKEYPSTEPNVNFSEQEMLDFD